ncbi:MAG: hypothetical protein GY740_14815 [Gammaproteobacteria bacterium]|nr:hypothetical protein [Gammaproteobacteria bacterium]
MSVRPYFKEAELRLCKHVPPFYLCFARLEHGEECNVSLAFNRGVNVFPSSGAASSCSRPVGAGIPGIMVVVIAAEQTKRNTYQKTNVSGLSFNVEERYVCSATPFSALGFDKRFRCQSAKYVQCFFARPSGRGEKHY